MELLNLTSKAGSRAEILRGIHSLTEENYISVFCDYLFSYDSSKVSEFEKQYILDLERNVWDLGEELLILENSGRSREELLKMVVNWGLSGVYSFESCLGNDELSAFIRDTEAPKEDKVKAVKTFMIDRLNAYCESLEKSSAQKAREKKLKQIEDYERSINTYTEIVKKLKEEAGL